MTTVADKLGKERASSKKQGQDKQAADDSKVSKKLLEEYIPLWSWTDLDNRTNWIALCAFRLIFAMTMTGPMKHADEY